MKKIDLQSWCFPPKVIQLAWLILKSLFIKIGVGLGMLGKKHSFRGSRFNFQHPHGSSQLAINPISENLISSIDTNHPQYTDIYADKTHIHSYTYTYIHKAKWKMQQRAVVHACNSSIERSWVEHHLFKSQPGYIEGTQQGEKSASKPAWLLFYCCDKYIMMKATYKNSLLGHVVSEG